MMNKYIELIVPRKKIDYVDFCFGYHNLIMS